MPSQQALLSGSSQLGILGFLTAGLGVAGWTSSLGFLTVGLGIAGEPAVPLVMVNALPERQEKIWKVYDVNHAPAPAVPDGVGRKW